MTDQNGVLRIAPGAPDALDLEDWGAIDPAKIAAGTPVQRGRLDHEDTGLGYSVGVWHCTAFEDSAGPYPMDEYMVVLEGTVEIRLATGGSVTVPAGEAFVLPRGLDCQWTQSGIVRKIFMILDTAAAPRAQNDALGRVVRVPAAALPAPAPNPSGTDKGADLALERSATCFVNRDGRMQVIRRDYPATGSGPAPAAGHHLVTVLDGALRVVPVDGAESIEATAGQTLYLPCGSAPLWQWRAGTRLIDAIFAPAA